MQLLCPSLSDISSLLQKSALWSTVGAGDASKVGPAGAQGGAPSVSGAAGGLLPGQTAPQGIFHSWVSMVAEQMGHHDVHYPWVNGEVRTLVLRGRRSKDNTLLI